MPLLDRFIPAATIIITTILVALPWGMAAENRFILPLLPLIVIHYWTVRRPGHVAEWWVFLAGISLDILTHGPLGYWALIYLLGFAAAKLTTEVAEHSPISKWLFAALTFLALSAGSWALSSLYYFELADWRPYALAALAAAVIYPLIGVVLRGLTFSQKTRRNVFLKRSY